MYHMIYQISGKPIPPDERNNSTFFFDTHFSKEVANHIDDVEDRAAELKQFCHEPGAISDALSNLENSFFDAYGDYICRESEDPVPMDEFLRTVTPGAPHYLGGLCKYQL